MKKKLVIENCLHCPSVRQEYTIYTDDRIVFEYRCMKSEYRIIANQLEIPDWCPLPDDKEDSDSE